MILASCGTDGADKETTAAQTTAETTAAATTAPVTELNLKAAGEAVKNGADYSSVTFTNISDEYSADALYVYFAEDNEIIDALDDFEVDKSF